MKPLIIITLLLITTAGHALERDYQTPWCKAQNGAPFTLPNGTEIDCLTQTHAIEVDFAKKFYEAIGQSLYYAMHTGKRAGILLIIDLPKEQRFLTRLRQTIRHYKLPIDVFLIQATHKK